MKNMLSDQNRIKSDIENKVVVVSLDIDKLRKTHLKTNPESTLQGL